MAFTYGFYNYSAGDAEAKLYDAEQMSKLFDGLITDGVYGHVGSCFMVYPLSGDGDKDNKVIIGTGRGWFNHTWVLNDSSYIMQGDQAAPHSPGVGGRIDALVIDVDRQNRVNKFDWYPGEVSDNPVRPTIPSNTESHSRHVIAYVTRHPNVEVIESSDIVSVVGTETPYVTGVLETLDTSEIISQFEHDFEAYIESLPKTVTYQMPLAAGQTTVTFENVTIPQNSLVTVGTSVIGLDYNNMTRNGNNITIIFDKQSYNATVYLFVMETFYPITMQQQNYGR